MKRLFLGLAASSLVGSVFAFNIGDLIPKNPQDIKSLISGDLKGICNQVFRDSRDARAVATSVCGSIGVLIGQNIKAALREREQVRLAEATNETLKTGQTQKVKTEEGNNITTEMVRPASTNPQPAGGVVPTADSGGAVVAEGDCGTVKQTIITKDNQRIEDTVNVCKKGGTWVAG